MVPVAENALNMQKCAISFRNNRILQSDTAIPLISLNLCY